MRSFQFTPALAERWEQPNPLTLVFHLRSGVRFHDGRPLTARDVVWTIESMIDAANPGGSDHAQSRVLRIDRHHRSPTTAPSLCI
jgi:peptide/nickel transport system substrate-binding protein